MDNSQVKCISNRAVRAKSSFFMVLRYKVILSPLCLGFGKGGVEHRGARSDASLCNSLPGPSFWSRQLYSPHREQKSCLLTFSLHSHV